MHPAHWNDRFFSKNVRIGMARIGRSGDPIMDRVNAKRKAEVDARTVVGVSIDLSSVGGVMRSAM